MQKLKLNTEKYDFLQKSETEKIKYSFKLSKIKKILVASTLCGEGKTAIALNVCVALAEDGEKVLYIGRKSQLINISEEDEETIVASGTDNFDIMISSDLKKTTDVMGNRNYDYVLVEAPAMEESKDGIFLADCSDVIMLVVETNRAGYSQLRESRKLLTEGNCKDIRIVLNRIKKHYGILKRRENRRN